MASKPLCTAKRRPRALRPRALPSFSLGGLRLSLCIVCAYLLPRTFGESNVYEQLPSSAHTSGQLEDGLEEHTLPAPNAIPLLTNPSEPSKIAGQAQALETTGQAQALALLESTLLVSTLDGKVYALETATGKLRWAFDTGANLVSVSNVAASQEELEKGTHSKEHAGEQSSEGSTRSGAAEVMIPGADGSLYRVDSEGLVELYHRSVKEVEDMAPSVASDGGLLFGSHRVTLFALDPFTGQTLRTFASENNKVVHGTPPPPTTTAGNNDPGVQDLNNAKYGKDEGADIMRGGEQREVAVGRPAVYVVRKDYTVTKHHPLSHEVQWNASYSEVSTMAQYAQDGTLPTYDLQRMWESSTMMSVSDNHMLEVRMRNGATWRRQFPNAPAAVFSPRGYLVKDLIPSLSKDLKTQPHTVTLIPVGAQGVMMRLPGPMDGGLISVPKQVPAPASEVFDYTHLDLGETRGEGARMLLPSRDEPQVHAIPESRGNPFFCPSDSQNNALPAPKWMIEKGGGGDNGSVAISVRKTHRGSSPDHNAVGPEPQPSPELRPSSWDMRFVYTFFAAAVVFLVAVVRGGFIFVRNWLGYSVPASPQKDVKKKKKRGGGAGKGGGGEASSGALSDGGGGRAAGMHGERGHGIPPEGMTVGSLWVSPKVLGSGSNGTRVFEGKYMERRIAVKRVLIDQAHTVDKEVKALIISDEHESIVRCFSVEERGAFKWLALEYCHCNLFELISYLSPSTGLCNSGVQSLDLGLNEPLELWDTRGLPTYEMLQLLIDIVAGVVHLHKMNIVHRDLKPQNILLTTNSEGQLRAKLSDMGISRRLEHISESFHNTNGMGPIGSAGYKAPEQLLQPPRPQTAAVDAFALGCVLFFCVSGGHHPFSTEVIHRDSNIASGKGPDFLLIRDFPEALDLISHLLAFKPEDRYTAFDALHHPMLWSSQRRLSFLMEVSDRIEGKEDGTEELIVALEEVRMEAIGSDWKAAFTKEFRDSLSSHRSYDSKSLRDLLRIIRNKYHHYRELPGHFQAYLGYLEGYEDFFRVRFPKLLIEVYKVIARSCHDEPAFSKYCFPHRAGHPSK